MEDAVPTGTGRRSRFWLYAPFVLLLLVAMAWSAAWFAIRNRVGEAFDGWLAREASLGRQWTCQDRRIAGYPFRIEMICGALSLRSGPVTASFGRVEAVAQIYQPRLVIAEIEGPLSLSDGKVSAQATWELLQTSVHVRDTGLQRFSLAARAPNATVTGLAPQAVSASAESLELHARPNPARRTDKAYDAALLLQQAKVPALDALIGGNEPTNLSANLTVSEAEGFRGRPITDELERWRRAGGRLDIAALSATKGPRRLEAKGDLRLDEMHRPAGNLEIAAAGLDGVIGNLTGNRSGAAIISALLGGQRSAAGNAAPQLTPLPPIRLENGYLSLGPFVIPNVRLQPLY